ncbi:hypothetical protein NDU88_005480 [Pleurodeles waltl]|uniref:t-SNARE coiled-coil homology domain-containing protein n=1 Tax=Pleurodeles waltl TaxID=8319 RepID=A0AAV7VLW4_PLEWA|nr:hypothetical protein NDU88_005480 [Pleurodeles waltl]
MGMVSEDQESNSEPELLHILVAMQSGLATIYSKIDLLSHRMDSMSERLDKQVEHVDEVELRISAVEDDYNAMSEAQTKTDKTVAAGQGRGPLGLLS